MENVDVQRDRSGGGALDGQVIAGRYRVARVVSTGASTVIIDAIDIESDSPVTVKIVRPEHSADPEFRRKFRKLAEVSQALTHPNIASVTDWGEIELAGESTVFWTVEALGGGSLRDLLDRGRLLEPGQALVIGLEACRALDAAHQKGLFHTELTPSKMVFGADRRLRVVDFGMARLLAEPAWVDASAVPTHVARYASPEQALGLPIDAKTDIYALALVMIEAVTGAVPFAADSTVATLAGRVDKLLPVSADLGALASVLEHAGRPESPDRFTAAEFGRALVQVAPRLSKPKPIPIVSTGRFDTTAMRRPNDPTGGVERPAPVPGLSGVDESGVAAVAASVDVVAPVSRAESDPTISTPDPPTVDEPDVPDDVSDSAAAPEPVPEPEPDRSLAAATAVEPPAFPEPEAVLAPLLDTSAVHESDVDPDVDPGEDLRIADQPTTVSPVVATDEPIVASEPVLYDDAPRRRAPIVLLVVLLLAGLGALGYAGSLLLQPKSFEVPVLAGVPDDEALNQIAGNDWELSIESERSDSFPVPDTVIRTAPGPGVELEEGKAFTLVLSAGPEFRVLPDVDGLPFDAAVTQLATLGLVGIEGPERQFSETAPVDAVISWQVQGDADASMSAGAQILPGETIVMVLSTGPEPRGVPNLAGQTIEQATAALDTLQLGLSQGEDVFSEDVPAGMIIGQDPAADSSIERGGIVMVQVSKGQDRIAFPALDGLAYADAEALLIQNGFTIGNLLGTTDGTFVQATIDGEDAAVGALFRRQQAVDLIFL